MSDREELEAAIAAMLDGNRVKFGEYVSDLMAGRAAVAVDDMKDQLAQSIFNFNDEEDQDEDLDTDEVDYEDEDDVVDEVDIDDEGEEQETEDEETSEE